MRANEARAAGEENVMERAHERKIDHRCADEKLSCLWNDVDLMPIVWWIVAVKNTTILICSLSGLLGLTSCESLQSFNKPLDSNSSFDPLDPAGSSISQRNSSATVDASAARYSAGQWVETSMANSTFFKKIPKGNATASQVLAAGTPLKVISAQGTYVKVELESGAVGYIPEMMVAEQAVATDVPIMPVIDPSIIGPPPVDGLYLAPEPEVPGIGTEGAPSFSIPEPEVNPDTEPKPDNAPKPDKGSAGDDVAPEPEIPGLEEGDVPPPPEVEGITATEDLP